MTHNKVGSTQPGTMTKLFCMPAATGTIQVMCVAIGFSSHCLCLTLSRLFPWTLYIPALVAGRVCHSLPRIEATRCLHHMPALRYQGSGESVFWLLISGETNSESWPFLKHRRSAQILGMTKSNGHTRNKSSMKKCTALLW